MSIAMRHEVRQRRLADPAEAQKVFAEDAMQNYTEADMSALLEKAKEIK